MISLGQPYGKSEIIEAWSDEYLEVGRFFAAIEGDAFFAAPAGVWSPAENLVHLIRSAKPVALALRIPKPLLMLRFGRMHRPSRSFAAMRSDYVDVALAGGAVASGSFVPQVTGSGREVKQRILTSWNNAGRRLEQELAGWSEAALDRSALPHPVLGTLSVREMLFFTLYHTMHHVNDVQRLLGRPVSEWFGGVGAGVGVAEAEEIPELV
ncbi:MAG TPA: DinB family protein [Herpetosiphonaceae bacterium]|nr:DinB family protein [Herpetosiphonaceae bacterium]